MSKIEHYRAFNGEFFRKHQGVLLWLLNYPVIGRWFRWVMRIRPHDCDIEETIVALAPNNYKVFLGVDDEKYRFRADFRTHDKYGKRLYRAFMPLWWAMHIWDSIFADRIAPTLSFGFATLTAYPDPNPETSTVDGGVFVSSGSGSASFATKRNAAVGDGTDGDAASQFFVDVNASGSAGSPWDGIWRGITLFDTSSLTSAANISAATLSLFGNAKNDDFSQTVHICSSSPASNTAIVAADYAIANFGSTSFGSIAISAFSTTAYNEFALNASGISNISKTSISKFGGRISADINNAEPTWASLDLSYVQIYYAEQTGTTNDPKLVVTYTTTNIKTWNGLADASTKTVNALARASVKTKNGLA